MIKALLDIRDLNNKNLVKNYENYKKNEINKNADISSNDKDTVDNNQSQYMKIKNDQKCIFGQISNFALKLNNIRTDFRCPVRGGSKAPRFQLTNLCDFFNLLPRVVADGLLSPYPKNVVSKGIETGRIGRILSGIETSITYTFLLSFILL